MVGCENAIYLCITGVLAFLWTIWQEVKLYKINKEIEGLYEDG
jgi:hypothetical protein